VPVGALAMFVFNLSFAGKRVNEAGARIDYAGIAAFTGMLLSLLLALGSIADRSVSPATITVSLAIALALLILFIRIECKASHPLMPLPLFIQPIIAISSISLFVTGIGMFGSVLLIPLFLQIAMGVSAATSGALLTPLILTVAASSVAGGVIISKTKQYKSLILFALLLMTTGVYLLSRISEATSITMIISYMLVVGFGMGLLLPVYPIVIQNAVPQDKVGTVTGFSQFFRSIGGTIGVALFGSLMLSSYRKHLSESVSASVLQLIDNPLHPARLKLQIASAVNTPAEVESTLLFVKHALVAAIDHVFVLYTGALAVTLIISLWLEDRPLRTADEPATSTRD